MQKGLRASSKRPMDTDYYYLFLIAPFVCLMGFLFLFYGCATPRSVSGTRTTTAIYIEDDVLHSSPRFSKQCTDIRLPINERRRSFTCVSFANDLQNWFTAVSCGASVITAHAMHQYYSQRLPVTMLWAENLCRLISPQEANLTRACIASFLILRATSRERLFFAFSVYDLDGSGGVSEIEFATLLECTNTQNQAKPIISAAFKLFNKSMTCVFLRQTTPRTAPENQTLTPTFYLPTSFDEFTAIVEKMDIAYLFDDSALLLFRFSEKPIVTVQRKTWCAFFSSQPACFLGPRMQPSVFRLQLLFISIFFWIGAALLAVYISAIYSSQPFGIRIARLGGLLLEMCNVLVLSPFVLRLGIPNFLCVSLHEKEIHRSLGVMMLAFTILHVIGWGMYYSTITQFELTMPEYGAKTVNVTGIVLFVMLLFISLTALFRGTSCTSYRVFLKVHKLHYIFWVLLGFHSART